MISGVYAIFNYFGGGKMDIGGQGGVGGDFEGILVVLVSYG